ncbi:hypothetical protein ACHAWF_008732 [Thalassiosira exigua]
MASSFYRLARRSLPSTAAAAATVTAAVALTLPEGYERRECHDDSPRARGSLAAIGPGAGRSVLPSPLSILSPRWNASAALCEAPPPRPSDISPAYKPSDPAEPVADQPPAEITGSDGKTVRLKEGIAFGAPHLTPLDPQYHGLFPRRQLWRPRLEYPLWDSDWDDRRPPPIPKTDEGEGVDASTQMTEAQRERRIRKEGVTRHIILIRHGQYDETHKEDSKRLLTPLGRRQAELTGKRLGKLIRGVGREFGPCRVKVVRVSDLARAKETADIIYDNMDLDDFSGEIVDRAEPDPLLNEGRPCHHIPGGKARSSVVERTDEHHPRIEQAFRKYFFRAQPPLLSSDEDGESIISSSTPTEEAGQQQLKPDPQHEFEVIVCHANVIRYFFCRALQLPPEAWLRLCTFNCSMTYFTIRPTGTVSCRMLGDIGHLPYDLCTFSMHPGFNW